MCPSILFFSLYFFYWHSIPLVDGDAINEDNHKATTVRRSNRQVKSTRNADFDYGTKERSNGIQYKSRRPCITCSYRSIERKQFKNKNTRCFQKQRVGLRCKLCSRFMCIDCIQAIYPQIAKHQERYHSDCSQYLEGIKLFYESKGKLTPSDFVNHCCLITQHSPKKGKRKRTNEIPTRSNKKSLLGGAFCVPEFQVIIPIDFGSMDILGLGEEPGLPSRYHYVIDEVNAALHERNDVSPLREQPKHWKHQRLRKLKVDLPHVTQHKNVKKRKTSFICDIYYVPLTVSGERVAGRKGSNEIKSEDVKKSYFFHPKENAEISVIIGYNEGSDRGSILLLRFHNLRKDLVHEVSDIASKKMWEQIFRQLPNQGIERRRSGGSSGYVTYDLLLKQLMATPNSTPRCSTGVIWLLDKDRLRFHAFYMNTTECERKYFIYTTPRWGGSFVMDPTLIADNTLLQDFIMTKPLSAAIIKEIEDQEDGNFLPAQFRVCPAAVSMEQCNANEARNHTERFYPDKSKHFPERKREYYGFYSEEFNKFTLVSHPVGQHLDVFADNKPSLENRLCFTHAVDSSGSYGRGGNGLDYFTWALLDWESKLRRSRRRRRQTVFLSI